MPPNLVSISFIDVSISVYSYGKGDGFSSSIRAANNLYDGFKDVSGERLNA